MTFSAQQNELVKLYVAGFLRAPEKGGFEYWSDQLARGVSVDQLADTIFSLSVVKQIYADTLSNSDFVTKIYQNVFNKAPDAGGLKYWNTQLDGGLHRGKLVLDMINAGLNVADGTSGKSYIVNRTTTATSEIQSQLTQRKEIAPDTLKTILGTVTSDSNSVNTALSTTSVELGKLAGVVGQAFTNEFVAAVIHWQIDHQQYTFDNLSNLQFTQGSTHASISDLISIDLHPTLAGTTPGYATVSLYHEHNWKLTAQDLSDFATALAKDTYFKQTVGFQESQDVAGYIHATQAATGVYDQLVAQAPNLSAVWF